MIKKTPDGVFFCARLLKERAVYKQSKINFL